ncbi:hypothetical protein Pfo_025689 [Paulownia fortunei]|nr:hypothetical protein Pfo_025689 [Paulownia fortunei]
MKQNLRHGRFKESIARKPLNTLEELLAQAENYIRIEETTKVTFMNLDLDGSKNTHNDALVISTTVSNFWIKKILVDSRSLADIIFYNAFTHFSREVVEALGEIYLPMSLGSYPKKVTKMIKFFVVKAPSTYNIILGRPALNLFRPIASTYHMKLKFPTPKGIGEVKGDKKIARECYASTLHRANSQLKRREENDVIVDKGKQKVVLSLEDGSTDDTMNEKKKMKLVEVRLEAIEELKAIELIFGVPQKKWCLCIDFIDLNKACPKDPFPLPRIDLLVDSTSGYELLCFLDAYQGYNQIQLVLEIKSTLALSLIKVSTIIG